MTLPELNLDDRTFQDLVSEARLKVMEACEFTGWTEHNVSDPGITLIELFAWMTEMTIYRLNRVPEKIHLALLDLLGLGIDPPEAASADIWFRLKQERHRGHQDSRVRHRGGDAADTGGRAGDLPDPGKLHDPRAQAGGLRRRARREARIGAHVAADGAANPSGPIQQPFGTLTDRTLYLGFDRDPSQLIIRVDAHCGQAHGTGIKPSDPPLHWYVSQGPGKWSERLKVIDDTTDGFNKSVRIVELLVPRSAKRTAIDYRMNRELYWLCCRLEDKTRAGHDAERFKPDNRLYKDPPDIWFITARAVGASLSATHTILERERATRGERRHGRTDTQAPSRPDSPARSGP